MMDAVVYGKKNCGLCEAAKEKLGRLGVRFVFVDLESPGEHWRTSGATDAMAMYQQINTLPIIRLSGRFVTYPEAMKSLKKGMEARE